MGCQMARGLHHMRQWQRYQFMAATCGRDGMSAIVSVYTLCGMVAVSYGMGSIEKESA